MNYESLDPRFCGAALDALKSYRRVEFALRFLENSGLPVVDKTLDKMWARIERWIEEDASRCRDLWAYVDDLRMWGKQRVFLFEVEKDYAEYLSDSKHVRERVGSLYDEAVYQWEAEKPFVASVRHTKAANTGAPLLVFKLIEDREYELAIDGQLRTFEERSTNFFILDLKNRHAELRIQELPTGAKRDVAAEHDRLTRAVGNYLDLEKFKRIALAPVMDVILRHPPYTITASKLKFTEQDFRPEAPELVSFLKRLFRPGVPVELTGYWACSQDVLGKSRLHFKLSGVSDYIDFGGIADPDRVRDILEKLVGISREASGKAMPVPPGPVNDKTEEPPIWVRGGIDKTIKALEDEPTAQAIVLSAGAIAASVIWVLAEAIGNIVFDETLDHILRGLPVTAITVPVEIVWIISYYGWRRVRRGFKMLLSLRKREVWMELNKARKRRNSVTGQIGP